MKVYIIIICLIGVLSEVHSHDQLSTKIVRANNKFSQRLYQQIAVGDNNQVCSGYSVHVAMSTVSLGARSGTRRQMDTKLGLSNFTSKTERKRTHKGVIVELNTAPSVNVITVNGIFVNQDRTVTSAFVNNVRNYYQADVSTFDPSDPAGPEAVINDYVESKTQGLIQNLVPPNTVSGSSSLVLVNTIYFNASWQNPFLEHETRPADFFTTHGTSQVPTMFSTRTMKIKRNVNGTDVGELPLGDGRFSFFIILPQDVNGLAEQEAFLTITGRLGELFQGRRNVRVNVSLPKFNIQSVYELKDSLQALGIVKAFDQAQANFEAINSAGGIYISNVFHQAVIQVNEAGVVATAARAVSTRIPVPLPATETFYVNRPFLFFIRDNVQRLVLLQGKYIG